MQIESYIGDEPCIVKVLSWEYYTHAKLSGPPEDCYPDDGGYGEWEVCGMDGKPNEELASQLSDEDIERINQELFDEIEVNDEEYNDYEY